MTIDELFQKYPKNIIGFRVYNQYKVIDFWIPKSWVLEYDETQIEFNKHKENEDGTLIYYTASSDDPSMTFIDIFKELERVFEYNINLIKKKQLLDEKIKLLKNTFESLDYESLERLSFVVDKPELESMENTVISTIDNQTE